MRHDIIIAGVGGQGILTIARVLSMAAIAQGLNVKQAEVHGMSQRGGAVYSHLRISDREIFSDLIPAGQADMILAIEPLEALRYVSMLKEGGTIVTSTNAEVNITDYPAIEEVLQHIAAFRNHIAIDMEKLARGAGGVLAANIVALGAASLYLGFGARELEGAVEALFTRKGERVVQTNIRAFRFGRTAATGYLEALQRGAAPDSVRGWIATLSPEHLASPDDLDFEGLTFEVGETGLSGAEAHAFESLLKGAYDEGRRQLYEHEVYRLIELVGAISPPRHVFVPKGSTIAEEVLEQFPGERVVLKLVSPEVVHKSDAGAVVIVPKSIEGVRSELDRLVARHSDAVSVAGVLVVEFVEHESRGLGGELFVGIRATREFGPVIAAGLGGVQTEYLASKMRPGVAVAKAVALDTDAETFLEQFKETAAYDLLSGRVRGQDRLVSDGELLRCFRAFISIARKFCVDRGEEGPDIGEMEVNPFAFVGQRLVPLDGRGRLRPAAKAAPPRRLESVRAMLEPQTIGLIGVSQKEGSIGRIILANILRSGFDPAQLVVLKPDATELDGVKCVPSLSDLESPLDLLVITAPAAAVPDIVANSNSRSAIVISGGAGEAEGTQDIGERIKAALVAQASSPYSEKEGGPVAQASSLSSEKLGANAPVQAGSLRYSGAPVLLGPNCMGVQSRPGRYDTFFIPEAKLPARTGADPQPLAIISQSGAFIVSRISALANLSPMYTVSIGNQCDITVSDLIRALDEGNAGRGVDFQSAKAQSSQTETELRRGLGQSPSTRATSVLGIYMEGFADLDGLETLRAIESWTKQGKTAVFYKAGRTDSGRSAAAGHTAAVAGDYDICQTAMRQAGALVAEDFREFSQLLETATLLSGKTAEQGRIFAVTNAGMEAVAMADAIAGEGPIRLASLGDETDKRLRQILKDRRLDNLVGIRNPLDVTPMAGEAAYGDIIDAALADDEIDAVIVSCVPLAPTLNTLPSELDDPEAFPQLAGRWAESRKPVVFVVDSGEEYDMLARRVRGQGVPVFRSADEAMRRLSLWMANRIRVASGKTEKELVIP